MGTTVFERRRPADAVIDASLRDTAFRVFWLDDVERAPHPALSGTVTADLAIVGGGIATGATVWATTQRTGTLLSRVVVAVSLMVYSAVFIQETHGLVEMHFHIFVVLAFLLVYRDARAQRFEEGTNEIQKTIIAREVFAPVHASIAERQVG